MFAFHLEVPDGVQTLDIHLDFLPTERPRLFRRRLHQRSLAMLSWNEVVLYRRGERIRCHLCAFGQAAARLELCHRSHHTAAIKRPRFAAVPLEQLIDSPLLSGKYFREVPWLRR